MKYIQEHGFDSPFLFMCPEGLGMRQVHLLAKYIACISKSFAGGGKVFYVKLGKLPAYLFYFRMPSSDFTIEDVKNYVGM